MRLLLAFTLSLSAIVAWAAPTTAKPELELQVVGDIEIDHDGSVREYTVSSKLAPALQRVVEKHVREWAFEPIAVDGNPVIATTAVRLQLRAVPIADDYRLQVESVSFGEARAGKTPPPRYPAAAVSAGIGARVLLQAKLDPQGRVVAVHPYQTSLSGPKVSDAKAKVWRERFERVSLVAVADWVYEPSETVDGKYVEQTALIPIAFQLSNSPTSVSGDGRWREYVPGPITPAPWSNAARIAADTDKIADGETRSLSSRFRLKDDIAGAVL